MKVSKKAAACLCALMMATSSIAVFSVSAADTEGQAASAAQTTTEAAASENVKFGKVTEIDGSQLTVALGEFSGKKLRAKAAEGEEGTETPEKAGRSRKMKARSFEDQADSQTDSEAQPSENEKTAESGSETDGTQAAEKKTCGRKNGGKGGCHGKFTENGTTETVTVSEDVTVTKKGEAVTASDISVGDIVKLKYDENDELAEVKVSAKHKHGRKPAEAAAEDSTADSDQSATA